MIQSFAKRLAHKFGVDRAVSYAMIAKAWQIPSGAVTTLLVALCFSGVELGVYGLLLTLTGMQALADAGLLNTLLHAASHETVGSRFDESGFLRASTKSLHRLAGMLRFAIVWFSSLASLLFLAGAGAGFVLLQRKDMLDLGWVPLLAAMVMATAVFAIAPCIAILEGCHQVRTINRMRVMQAMGGSLAVWLCLSTGFGLWSPALALFVQFAFECGLLLTRYRRFFIQLLRTTPAHFDWRSEIWPLQWRIGVQSVIRYLAFFPIYPILFDVHGAVLAGRYGLTWQVINNLVMVSYVFVRTRSPEFGRLIAEGRRDEARHSFRRAAIGSTILLVVGVSLFCIALLGLNQLPLGRFQTISQKFLPIPTVVCFAAAAVLIHTTQCYSLFIRSQKFDPIWRVSIPGCLSLAVLASLAAYSGKPRLIAAAMITTFGLSTLALAMMNRWYNVYFKGYENRD